MARPPAPKPSLARRFRQSLAGFAALACLTALFFALLRWRVNTPDLHLNFSGISDERPPTQSHE
jgi:hypothetical protein